MPTTASNPVKDNHACFSCLKRARRDHRISNCSRRKQCTEKENGVQCSWYHHPLLYKSTDLRVSISSVTDNQDALLPVIAVDISGQGGIYKRGNVLLDLGAQITVIRVETAESLGLEGKNVSISDEGIIRVGGRMDKAIVSYEAKHPALLPLDHKISRLITQEAHQCGHPGMATTAAKTRTRYWILRVHDLAKTVKFKCVTCREMEPKTERQIMADLPNHRTAPDSPPFYFTSCDYFGPLTVKVGRNKTTKHYGVVFTCVNTRAVHLEIATDCTTMELIHMLRRFPLEGTPL